MQFKATDIPSFLLKRECGNDGYLRRPGQDANAFLYFIGEPDADSPVKIGYSAWPQRRLSAIQVSSPVDLVILAKVWCLSQWERELHEIFKADRIRGEWFRRTPRLKRVIECATTGDLGALVNLLYSDYEPTGDDAMLGADQVILITEDGDVLEQHDETPDRVMTMRENVRRRSGPSPRDHDVWTEPS